MKREQIEADLPQVHAHCDSYDRQEINLFLSLSLPLKIFLSLPFNITGGVQLAAGGGKEGEGEV